ncbi:hypothetical protein [Streptomyces luteolus]|uniref:Secreted protein n=1 Tax=Streptomyces luteolus TaxID=3043615 RepID=A0ABT6STS4_9ACTN|nr:hypothetical protein [Streptomyces sp. B-S-A12]MDI3419017.1 hypothetical protein [Streptomyces sp. B-S-A12]
MRIRRATRLPVAMAVSLAAVAVAPVLLVAGDPLRHLYLRHVVYRPGAPPVSDKRGGWVSVHWFVLTNPVVRALCRPSAEFRARAGRRRQGGR